MESGGENKQNEDIIDEDKGINVLFSVSSFATFQEKKYDVFHGAENIQRNPSLLHQPQEDFKNFDIEINNCDIFGINPNVSYYDDYDKEVVTSPFEYHITDDKFHKSSSLS